MRIENIMLALIVSIFIMFLILKGFIEYSPEVRELFNITDEEVKIHKCDLDLSKLSCDELLDCYDRCSIRPIITHQNACRDKLKARLWKCYGEVEQIW